MMDQIRIGELIPLRITVFNLYNVLLTFQQCVPILKRILNVYNNGYSLFWGVKCFSSFLKAFLNNLKKTLGSNGFK